MLQRPSSRLLVVDSAARLLLFRFEHKEGGLAGQAFWATPGGGLDPGETYAQAAVRELYEETGLRIDDPGPEVARRHASFALVSGEMAEADERFFLVRVDGLDLSASNWTELERSVMVAHRWWTRAELKATHEQVWPETLDEIMSAAGVWTPPFGRPLAHGKKNPTGSPSLRD